MSNKYSYLRRYINNPDKDSNNWFEAVSYSEILESQNRIGIIFPDQLIEFYKEIGYGFLVSSKKATAQNKNYPANRINPPSLIAEILLEGPESGLIAQETFEYMEKGDIPFFEISDSTSFLFLKTESDNPNAVWSLSGIKIEDSFEKFIWRLYHESPTFYEDIIELHYAIENGNP